MSKRILGILGHPSDKSFCNALADSYIKGAKSSGSDVQLISLGHLSFDPVLHNGYNTMQQLEPDLVNAQTAITWTEHIVFVYPTCWGAMPALQKGFIDRVFLPGFTFKFRENSSFLDRLLSGRSAHLSVSMDTPPWHFRLVYRVPDHNQMKRTILEFSGIKPVTISSFGPIKNAKRQTLEKFLLKANNFGRYA